MSRGGFELLGFAVFFWEGVLGNEETIRCLSSLRVSGGKSLDQVVDIKRVTSQN